MEGFHLPAPWNAPRQERTCDRCGKRTLHYGRRITTAADHDSDRAAGEVVWFCNECGYTPHQPPDAPAQQAEPSDDLTELFDRH